MTLASRTILHSPVTDQTLLEAFVEQCLSDHVALLAIVGPGCVELEEAVDWIVVGDGTNIGNGTDGDRFLLTSSHPDATVEEVKIEIETWGLGRGDPVQEVRF